MANFEPMDSILASGTWKNLRVSLRSCSFRERDPVMKLIWPSILGAVVRCRVTFGGIHIDSLLGSGPLGDVDPYITHSFEFQNAEDSLLRFGRKSKRYVVRSHLPESVSRNRFPVVSFLWPSCICCSSSFVRRRSISQSLAAFHIESLGYVINNFLVSLVMLSWLCYQ